jgi:hypothetical protein
MSGPRSTPKLSFPTTYSSSIQTLTPWRTRCRGEQPPAHQRELFCVKGLVGALPVVCPCIAEWGWSRQRVIGLVRRRAGLPMMSVEISVCLYAA